LTPKDADVSKQSESDAEDSFQISRRGFLVAGIASAASAGAISAHADTAYDDYELTFDLSQNRRHLQVFIRQTAVVAEVEEQTSALEQTQRDKIASHVWRLDARKFGPDARFALDSPRGSGDSRSYMLRVLDARYGRLDKQRLAFRFFLSDQDGRNRWHIRMWSTLWNNGFSNQLTTRDGASFVSFRDFVEQRPGTRFTENPTRPNAQKVLSRVTNSLVALRPGRPRVVFLAYGDWTIEARTDGAAAPLSALNPDIHLSEFTFGWCVPKDSTSGLIGLPTDPDVPPGLGFSPITAHCNQLDGDQSGTNATGLLGLGKAHVDPEGLYFGENYHGIKLKTPVSTVAEDGEAEPEAKALSFVMRRPKSHATLAADTIAEGAIETEWRVETVHHDVATGPLTGLSGILRRRAVLASDALDECVSEITFAADFLREAPFRVATPVGRLSVMGPVQEEAGGTDTREGSRNVFRNQSGRAIQAALAATGPAAGQSGDLKWFEATVELLEADVALPGSDYSRMIFARSELNLVYHREVFPTPLRGSFVKLDHVQVDGELAARFDLAQAKLYGARASVLSALNFRFANMGLEIVKRKDGGEHRLRDHAEIVTYAGQCGVLDTGTFQRDVNQTQAELDLSPEAGQIEDTRPVLVVEFPPQHILEEAFSLPSVPQAPDMSRGDEKTFLIQTPGGWAVQMEQPQETLPHLIDGEIVIDPFNPDHVTLALLCLDTEKARVAFRKEVAQTKSVHGDPGDKDDFDAFVDRFRKAAGAAVSNGGPHRQIPGDQREYIGPFALDADAAGVARRLQRALILEDIEALVESLFEDVRAQRKLITDDVGHPQTLAQAHSLEGQLESSVPSYQGFRSFFRDFAIERFQAQDKDPAGDLIEFYVDHDKLKNGEGVSLLPTNHVLRDAGAKKEAEDQYTKRISDQTFEGGLAEARLSGLSRLAFRVNCRDALTDARLTHDELDRRPDDDLGLGKRQLAFTMDALTDWSSMDLAVVRRAQNVYKPGIGGRLDGRANRRLDLTQGGWLDSLGFTSGPHVRSEQRLADIYSAMLHPPGPFETSIEIPARLQLSPSDSAVFLSPRPVPSAIFTEEKSRENRVQEPRSNPLFSARLFTDAASVGLRAVHSQDFRPEFVFSGLASRDGATVAQLLGSGKVAGLPDDLRLSGAGAPPPGNIAPWLIGPEETVSRIANAERVMRQIYLKFYDRDIKDLEDPERYSSLKDLFDGLPSDTQQEAAFCMAVITARDENAKPFLLPPMIEHICRRIGLIRGATDTPEGKLYQELRKFRAGLSANDRHQLVVETSTPGLPVIGRRGLGGEIVAGAGQVEADIRYQLADLVPGAALFVPPPIDVTELSLTALGGSFAADTAFEPPVAPRKITDDPLYDALSVEKWQQRTVLGRDVLTEIVYKGFLFPLGHRASLVKLTERTFLRDNDENGGIIRAYLRQRLFIRVGKPEKSYPAVGQANDGRAFPVDSLRIITTQTPDLVDPYDGTAPTKERAGSAGRIDLGGRPGLAFWPRIARIAGAEVRFEMALDDSFSDLPLIFVDNVAANDTAALQRLVAYYNMQISSPDAGRDPAPLDPVEHGRTLRFGGEKIRYAPEISVGSASLETDTWTLCVEGREAASVAVGDRIDDLQTFRFKNNVFVFSPLLQGVDQPPFYPVIESARVRLRQNERLTGQTGGITRARLDGNYLAHGLPLALPADASGDAELATEIVEAAKALNNGMQLFMVFVDQPHQTMGNKGDNSGGVFRPDGFIVGLSRSKGPVTRTAQRAIADAVLPPNAGPIPILKTFGGDDDFSPLAEIRHPSFASAFSGKTDKLPQKPVIRAASDPVPTRTTAAEANAAFDKSDVTELIEEAREIYKKLFSSDAKILGLVSLQDLLDYLGADTLSDPAEAAPQLTELIEYGADVIDQAGDDLTSFVKEEILRPLFKGVGTIREGWSDIDKDVREFQSLTKDLAKPVTLAEIFPELYSGLQSLFAAIETSLGITDDIEFFLSLSEVFEAGRRFLRAIQVTSRNPVARFETALLSRFDALRSLQLDVEENLKQIVEKAIEDLKNEIAERVALLIVPEGPDGLDTPFRLFPLPIAALTSSDATVQALKDAYDALYVTRRTARELVEETVLNAIDILESGLPLTIKRLLGHSRSLRFLRNSDPLSVKIPEAFEPRIAEARNILEAAAASLEDEVRQEARRRLKELEILVTAALDEALDEAVDGVTELLQLYAEDIAFAEQVYDRAKALFDAFEADTFSIRRVAAAAIALVELFTGKLNIDLKAYCSGTPFHDALAAIGGAVDLRKAGPCTPKLPDNAVAFDPDTDLCKSAPGAIDPNYDAAENFGAGASDPCLKLVQVHEKVHELHEDLEISGQTSAIFEKIVEDIEDVPNIKNHPFYQDTLKGNLENVFQKTINMILVAREQSALLHRDLVNDGLRLNAVNQGFQSALAKLGDYCDTDPTEIVTHAEKLPTILQGVLRGRRTLLTTTLTRTRTVLAAVEGWITDESVAPLVALGSVGAYYDEQIKDLSASAKQLFEDSKVAIEGHLADLEDKANDLATWIIETLRPLMAQLDGLMTAAAEGMQTVDKVVTEGADDATALAQDLLIGDLITFDLSLVNKVNTFAKNAQSEVASVRKEVDTTIPAPTSTRKMPAVDRLRAIIAQVEASGKTLNTAVGALEPKLKSLKVEFDEQTAEKRIEAALDRAEKQIKEELEAYFKGAIDQNMRLIDEAIRNAEAQISALAADLATAAQRIVGRLQDEALEQFDEFARKSIGANVDIKLPSASALDIPPTTDYTSVEFGTLQAIYDGLYQLRKKILNQVGKDGGRLELLVKGALELDARGLKLDPEPENRLHEDVLCLRAAFTGGENATPISNRANRNFLHRFLTEWAEGDATPILLVENLAKIATELIKGQIFDQIPFDLIQNILEEKLKKLIPARIKMGYDFGFKLSPSMKDATAGIFEPGQDTSFTVDSQIVIELAGFEPRLSFRSVGTMGRFNINLVGSFDAVKLKFSGARFIAESGAKARFDVDYDDFEIGPELDFVEALQSYFTPKDGSGFYLEPTFNPIGIEAGYDLPLGTVSIGTASFFNVAISASAVLPFTGDADARFRGSLSRRKSPFTISIAPYGGSGFFAIEANTNGIVGFEASFEFGGAAAFAAGPLTAQGRIMAGVYVRQSQSSNLRKVTEISGTFFAGGAANIWIFSFGASLYVRLGMVNGNMTGEAVFTFSFSMGIKDFEYSVTFWRKEGKNLQGSKQANLHHLRPGTRFAKRLKTRAVLAEVGGEDLAKALVPGADDPIIVSRVSASNEDWAAFLDYFDEDLTKEIEDPFAW